MLSFLFSRTPFALGPPPCLLFSVFLFSFWGVTSGIFNTTDSIFGSAILHLSDLNMNFHSTVAFLFISPFQLYLPLPPPSSSQDIVSLQIL